MPGHKGGREAGSAIRELLGEKPFLADVTNVPGMDDLHQPGGIIQAAQELAAQTFGADHSYFLINGSSCGLMALMMACCAPGEEVLVPRNIHRSILSGIILNGACPVFYRPAYDLDICIPLAVTPAAISRALKAHPQARAVFLVNPTYNGIVSDLPAIAEVVHGRGIPLVVDEAHGPHLGFHEQYPLRSLEGGADAVVQGTHKLLTAFTQASMLHLKGERVNRDRLEQSLKVLQSTSTSYLLLASLDAARGEMAERGWELLERTRVMAQYLRNELDSLPGVFVFDEGWVKERGAAGLDPAKVTVTVKELGLTGLWAESWLREKYDLQVEMSDLFNLLLIVTAGNTRADIDRLVQGLKEMAAVESPPEPPPVLRAVLERACQPPSLPLVCTPREAFFHPAVPVPLEQAVGRVAAETIASYPPGIPLLCPGERITREVVEFIALGRDLGLHFQGQQDPAASCLRVLV